MSEYVKWNDSLWHTVKDNSKFKTFCGKNVPFTHLRTQTEAKPDPARHCVICRRGEKK